MVSKKKTPKRVRIRGKRLRTRHIKGKLHAVVSRYNTATGAAARLPKANLQGAARSWLGVLRAKPRLSKTPNDNAYRALTQLCSGQFVPVVRYIFRHKKLNFDGVRVMGEALAGDPTLEGPDEPTTYTDSRLALLKKNEPVGIVIGELHAKPATELYPRIVDYAKKSERQYARLEGGEVRYPVPWLFVIYLRSTKKTPDEVPVTGVYPNGTTVTNPIAVLKMDQLTAQDIIAGKLYALVPFLIYKYEKEFADIETGGAAYKGLEDEYQKIWAAMRAKDSGVNVFVGGEIAAHTINVARHAAQKYPNVWRGVRRLAQPAYEDGYDAMYADNKWLRKTAKRNAREAKEAREEAQRAKAEVQKANAEAQKATEEAQRANAEAQKANQELDARKKHEIVIVIEMARENGASEEVVISQLQKRCKMSAEDAKAAVEAYDRGEFEE